ncbi:MAG: PilZ domain-containing protein [Gammaproteobacteria bacterium]
MERRYQQRKALDLDVVLYDGQGPVGAFKARNLSIGGIYIETGPMDLCVGDLLDVFCLVDSHRAKRHNLRGIVVHHTDDGVGVMFRDYDIFSLKMVEVLDGFSLKMVEVLDGDIVA